MKQSSGTLHVLSGVLVVGFIGSLLIPDLRSYYISGWSGVSIFMLLFVTTLARLVVFFRQTEVDYYVVHNRAQYEARYLSTFADQIKDLEEEKDRQNDRHTAQLAECTEKVRQLNADYTDKIRKLTASLAELRAENKELRRQLQQQQSEQQPRQSRSRKKHNSSTPTIDMPEVD